MMLCEGVARRDLKKTSRYKNVTDAFIENRRHGVLDQPFGKRHRVVPPTFHKIRVHAISFTRIASLTVCFSFCSALFSVRVHSDRGTLLPFNHY